MFKRLLHVLFILFPFVVLMFSSTEVIKDSVWEIVAALWIFTLTPLGIFMISRTGSPATRALSQKQETKSPSRKSASKKPQQQVAPVDPKKQSRLWWRCALFSPICFPVVFIGFVLVGWMLPSENIFFQILSFTLFFWGRLVVVGIPFMFWGIYNLVTHVHPKNLVFASPFRRAGASLIDSFLMGVVFFIGMYLMDTKEAWIGFYLLMTLYFGWGDSVLGGGQTLGKRFCHIQVVGEDYKPISFQRSLARSALWNVNTLCSFLTEISLSFLLVGVLGTGLHQIFFVLLLLCNPKRRGGHDYLCQTVVVNLQEKQKGPRMKITSWREDFKSFGAKGRILLGASCLLLLGGMGMVLGNPSTREELRIFYDVQRELRHFDASIQDVSIFRNWLYSYDQKEVLENNVVMVLVVEEKAFADASLRKSLQEEAKEIVLQQKRVHVEQPKTIIIGVHGGGSEYDEAVYDVQARRWESLE